MRHRNRRGEEDFLAVFHCGVEVVGVVEGRLPGFDRQGALPVDIQLAEDVFHRGTRWDFQAGRRIGGQIKKGYGRLVQNGNSALEQANTTLIFYPRFMELHKKIRRCQDLSRIAGEPQCMSLEGVTGAGKSTLVRNYAEQFPRCETEEGTVIPVFYLETPSPVTVKGMASVLLEKLGDPAAHKGTLWSMNSRAGRALFMS